MGSGFLPHTNQERKLYCLSLPISRSSTQIRLQTSPRSCPFSTQPQPQTPHPQTYAHQQQKVQRKPIKGELTQPSPVFVLTSDKTSHLNKRVDETKGNPQAIPQEARSREVSNCMLGKNRVESLSHDKLES
jgi:hypothetical protein